MREIDELKERIAILEALEKENQRALHEARLLHKDQRFLASTKTIENFQKQLIHASHKKQRVHTVQVAARRVCFVLLAVMCVGATAAFTVPEVRAQLTDLLIQITQGKDNNAVNLTHGVYVEWNQTNYPRYIPSEYHISGISTSDHVQQIEYRDSQNHILYFLQ